MKRNELSRIFGVESYAEGILFIDKFSSKHSIALVRPKYLYIKTFFFS